MPNGDPLETRRRILEAARAEFALHGLAGARVNTIASVARTSKERMYAYFGTKDEMFQAALGQSIEEWLNAIPFTVDDLPGYGRALFRHFQTHAVDGMLILWGQLAGRTESGILAGAEALLEGRRDEVRIAQRAGRIDAEWDPTDLFVLIYGVVVSWLVNPDEPLARAVSAMENERRSAVVHRAVAKLVAP
jgi:AcrR family transcriptional regulator